MPAMPPTWSPLLPSPPPPPPREEEGAPLCWSAALLLPLPLPAPALGLLSRPPLPALPPVRKSLLKTFLL